MESERIDEYLEALYKIQNEKSPVSTSALAITLKVSPPAVTDMLRSLKERGLVEYQPNRGAKLSTEGEKRALKVIRRHRLWERFLTDILGMKWDKVHDEACKLEHVVSPDIERELQRMVGDADTCPHGHSIPDPDGHIKDENYIPLLNLDQGQDMTVAAISKESPELLRRIEQIGLQPQTNLKVIKKYKDGSMEIEVNGEKKNLDREITPVILTKAVEAKKQADKNDEFPLSKLEAGKSAVVRSYSGGRGMLGRCLSLGFTPGSLVKMIENYNRGPVLVKVHDTSVALGRSLAEKIIVSPGEVK